MAPTNRPSLGFGDELESLDAIEFAKPKSATRPSPEATRQAAEATGFRSRESSKTPEPIKPARKEQRRHRTGRNAQINLKAKPETIETFQKIADAKGWSLGVAFEAATALLQREHGCK
ncbi:stability/partitioning determinant [Methylobacterium brachythecii]|uniref:Stability/partitioning determinant n=1 Tax=Methylobacterium brachythecii TaxID=1176177 RepID=A0A7W6F9Q1_9HYPH|nr:stability/partitioning determinant [Methylobacterium brachythecii]MBB3905674.1 hypothetical protein [Methylobacterium brachythecii]GLS46948.1 hypothetical protein GCM10007884_49480 [Methylobacterium brachythecii]